MAMLTLNGAALPDPSVLSVELQDALLSARRTLSGAASVSRAAVKRRVRCYWAYMPAAQLAAMLSALLPGGTLGEGFFTEAFDGGESRLVDMVSMTELAPLFLTEGERTLSAVEKNADNLVMEFVKTAKFVPFGAEIPVAYLIGLETAVKNLRILLSGKTAGLSSDAIRGRFRESYV